MAFIVFIFTYKNIKRVTLDPCVPQYQSCVVSVRCNPVPPSLPPSLPPQCPPLTCMPQLNSLQLCVDPASVLWINLFSRGLLRTLDQVKAFYHLQDSSKVDEHVDVRMDATQLKVRRADRRCFFVLKIVLVILFSLGCCQ